MKICYYILLSLYINWNIIKSQITLSTGKTFNFSIKNNTALVASFTFTSTGWAGVGIGKTTMSNCDMWIVEIISDKSFNLYDSYSQGEYKPSPDTALNGSNDLKNVQFSYANGKYTVTFERLLKTNDPFDYEIKIPTSSNINMNWAWGSGSLSDHGRNYRTGYFSIDTNNVVYFNGVASTAIPTTDSSTSTSSSSQPDTSTSLSTNTNSTVNTNSNNTTIIPTEITSSSTVVNNTSTGSVTPSDTSSSTAATTSTTSSQKSQGGLLAAIKVLSYFVLILLII